MSSGRRYDVFVSFNGMDTRRTFISHLFHELDRRGITTYNDYNELEALTESSASVTGDAIKGSRFAVVLVSQYYAASAWCLEELVKILDSHDKGSLTVFPVFYGVEPSDVRNQTGSFGQHFERLVMKRDPKNVEIWRSALTKLANIAGEAARNW